MMKDDNLYGRDFDGGIADAKNAIHPYTVRPKSDPYGDWPPIGKRPKGFDSFDDELPKRPKGFDPFDVVRVAGEPTIEEMKAAIEAVKIKQEYMAMVRQGLIKDPRFSDNMMPQRKNRPIYDFNKYDDSKTHLYDDMNSKTHIYDGDFDGDTVDRENMIKQNIMADSNRKIVSGLKDRTSNVNVNNVAKSGQTLNDNFKDAINQATDQLKD